MAKYALTLDGVTVKTPTAQRDGLMYGVVAFADYKSTGFAHVKERRTKKLLVLSLCEDYEEAAFRATMHSKRRAHGLNKPFYRKVVVVTTKSI